jgi:hypothetical protein
MAAAGNSVAGTETKKAGARPAFSEKFVIGEDQYFAMTGPPQR